MMFKPIDEDSYSRVNGMEIICTNSDGLTHRLTKGKTYTYTGYYSENDEHWFIFDDTGVENRFSKYRFRKATDLITNNGDDAKDVEIGKLKTELKLANEKIKRLERENTILIRLTDL